MVQLKDWQDDFEALGVRVAGLTYDAAADLATFGEEREIGYPLLSDEGSQYIAALGIRNEQYPEGHPGHGVALPGILFVDTSGEVRLKRAHENYRTRPPFEELLEATRALVEADAARGP